MNTRLKFQFIAAGKTQREVAIAIELPETRMSDFVREVKKPSMEEKQKIAKELGCKITEIF